MTNGKGPAAWPGQPAGFEGAKFGSPLFAGPLPLPPLRCALGTPAADTAGDARVGVADTAGDARVGVAAHERHCLSLPRSARGDSKLPQPP
ncbi:MAG TPA: hypothetical protein VIC54_11350 [Terriglobales bacterium]